MLPSEFALLGVVLFNVFGGRLLPIHIFSHAHHMIVLLLQNYLSRAGFSSMKLYIGVTTHFQYFLVYYLIPQDKYENNL